MSNVHDATVAFRAYTVEKYLSLQRLLGELTNSPFECAILYFDPQFELCAIVFKD